MNGLKQSKVSVEKKNTNGGRRIDWVKAGG